MSRANPVLVAGLFYVGFTAGLPGHLNIEVGPISLHLIVAIGVAWFGWQRMSGWVALRRYMRWAVLLSVWFLVSSIAAWDPKAVEWSVTAAIWFAFVVPGIASLLRTSVYRRAMLFGIAGAALVFALTSLTRLATGREIFDLPAPSRSLLLGVKRGLVNARLLFVVPLLAVNALRINPRIRWILAAAVVGSIVISGGRAGLLALGVVVLVYPVTQPGVSRKLKAILAAALLALVFVLTIGEFGGQAVVAKNRLVAYLHGERTASDTHRELQLRKAWHAGLQNPFFGIGYNHLLGRDDPALDDARNGRLRDLAQKGGTHNTYAQVFAEFGAPAELFFLLIIFSVIVGSVRRTDSREIRAALASFVGVMLTMVFDPIALSFFYFPLAYAIGAMGDEEARDIRPARRSAVADARP